MFDARKILEGASELLPPHVALSCGRLLHSLDASFGDEAAHLVGAPESRLREFISGRYHARQALFQLECSDSPIPSDPNGCPVWPRGFVGSISHKGDIILAVAARDSQYCALGIDLEFVDASDESLIHRISSPKECEGLERASTLGKSERGAVIFSAKEAAFKCIYPFARTRDVNFDDLELRFGPNLNFSVELSKTLISSSPIARFSGQSFCKFGFVVSLVRGSHVITGG